MLKLRRNLSVKKLTTVECSFAKIESMEFFSIIFAILFSLFWYLIMPVTIATVVSKTSEYLMKEELMKKETYENLSNDEYLTLYYIGWFLFLWFLHSQGYSYIPFVGT